MNTNKLNKDIFIFSLLIFLFYGVGYGQFREKFSKNFYASYVNIYVETSYTDPYKALYQADSLFLLAENPNEKIFALLLTSGILNEWEKSIEAFKFVEKAEAFASEKGSPFAYVWVYSMKSRLFKKAGLINEGKESLELALNAVQDFDKPSDKLFGYAVIYKEMGEMAMLEGKYGNAKNYLLNALKNGEEFEDKSAKNLFLGRVYQVLGDCNIKLGQEQNALDSFNKALVYFDQRGTENTIYPGRIYSGLGELYLSKNQPDSAQIYFYKALEIAELGKRPRFKKEVYQNFKNLCKTMGNNSCFTEYASKYDETVHFIENQESRLIGVLMTNLHNNPNKGTVDKKNKADFLLWFLGFTCLACVAVLIYFRKGNLRDKVNQKTTDFVDQTTFNNRENVEETSTETQMPLEIIRELDLKVQNFENELKFLDVHISLPKMVGDLNTNSKHLNCYFKEVLNTDFSNFINDRRINYIIKTVKENPESRNYKLTTISEMAGYASYSAFSANFKRITGHSPSEFIQDLSAEESDNQIV